jgi:hypothetical protein
VKIGLLHVYHLETDDWDYLVWGDPAKDELGTATKFVECLLDIPMDEHTVSVLYSGPSVKDGLSEGAYTKKFIVDRLQSLADFPRLKQRLDKLSATEYDQFVERVQGLSVGPSIKNTAAELEHAASYFAREQVDRVMQIAAATHAPRCMRNQASARYYGLIDKKQPWFVVASDTNYAGAAPDDVVIAEPLHRKDNPLYGFHPAWAEVAAQYPRLSLENKKEVLRRMDAIMADALAQQPESTEVVN